MELEGKCMLVQKIFEIQSCIFSKHAFSLLFLKYSCVRVSVNICRLNKWTDVIETNHSYMSLKEGELCFWLGEITTSFTEKEVLGLT